MQFWRLHGDHLPPKQVLYRFGPLSILNSSFMSPE